jgi:hypothetical protein
MERGNVNDGSGGEGGKLIEEIERDNIQRIGGDWDDILNYEQEIYHQSYLEGKAEAMKSSYEEGKEFGFVSSSFPG